jgi:hypothetical protein
MTTPARRQYIEGAPEALPEGEQILWEGKPDRAALARHAFHTRGLTVYFTVVIGLWALNTRKALESDAFMTMLLLQVGLAALAIGIAHALAYASARTTTYAVTDKRVVLRIGIVLPMTLNLPYRFVEGASTRVFKDGSGQIAVQLTASERLAWLVLWPHVRPWRVSRPEPLLRGLRDFETVGRILRDAAMQDLPADSTERPSLTPAPPATGSTTGVGVPSPAVLT